MDLLRPHYKDKNLNVKKILKSQWSTDPFSYGSVTSIGDEDLKKEFAKPEGRLVFAGEHTWGFYGGSLAGAWDSGSRAAKQILKKIKN